METLALYRRLHRRNSDRDNLWGWAEDAAGMESCMSPPAHSTLIVLPNYLINWTLISTGEEESSRSQCGRKDSHSRGPQGRASAAEERFRSKVGGSESTDQ